MKKENQRGIWTIKPTSNTYIHPHMKEYGHWILQHQQQKYFFYFPSMLEKRVYMCALNFRMVAPNNLYNLCQNHTQIPHTNKLLSFVMFKSQHTNMKVNFQIYSNIGQISFIRKRERWYVYVDWSTKQRLWMNIRHNYGTWSRTAQLNMVNT